MSRTGGTRRQVTGKKGKFSGQLRRYRHSDISLKCLFNSRYSLTRKIPPQPSVHCKVRRCDKLNARCWWHGFEHNAVCPLPPPTNCCTHANVCYTVGWFVLTCWGHLLWSKCARICVWQPWLHLIQGHRYFRICWPASLYICFQGWFRVGLTWVLVGLGESRVAFGRASLCVQFGLLSWVFGVCLKKRISVGLAWVCEWIEDGFAAGLGWMYGGFRVGLSWFKVWSEFQGGAGSGGFRWFEGELKWILVYVFCRASQPPSPCHLPPICDVWHGACKQLCGGRAEAEGVGGVLVLLL